MLNEFRWTDENTAKLRRCIDEKLSGAAAAVLLGCSRNAAIAKARRIGLTFQSASTQNTSRMLKAEKTTALPPAPTPFTSLPRRFVTHDEMREPLARETHPKPLIVEAESSETSDLEITSGGVPISNLNSRQCRAVISGDGAATRYCGGTIANRRFSFCAEHAERFLTTPAKMRAAAAREKAEA